MSTTSLVFLVLFGGGSVAALALRPIYGLYLYIAVFYLHPPSRWWGSQLPDLRWSLIAAAITLIAYFLHRDSANDKEPWYRSRTLSLFAVYVVWMWIQVAFVESGMQLEGAILFTKYLVLILLFYWIIETEEDFLRICFAHTIGCAYFGLLVYLAPDSGRLEGVGGPGVNDANTLGMHLGTGIFFASFLLLAAPKWWWRLIALGSIPFILNGVIQTETRGALVGIVLGGFFTIFLKPKAIRKTYWSLAILGGAAFLVLANEVFLERMSTLGAAVNEEQEWDSSAASRVEIAKSQIEMFKDYPLGVGHQGTAWLSPYYIDERWLVGSTGRRASHNTIMSVLVDQGIPGIILFTLIGIGVFRALMRLNALDRRGLPLHLGLYRTMLGGAIVTVFGSGMFAQYLKAEVQIWCIVLIVVLERLALNAVAEAESGSTVDQEASLPDESVRESAAST